MLNVGKKIKINYINRPQCVELKNDRFISYYLEFKRESTEEMERAVRLGSEKIR